MLWGRNHATAAAREYEAGQRFAPSDPILASRVARAWLGQSKGERALAAIDAALREHPHHAPLWALKGHALLGLGKHEASAQALEESIRQNPFDPSPHCDLVQAAKGAPAAAIERANCELLGGSRR
jgi:predicted Zn-dependent protease